MLKKYSFIAQDEPTSCAIACILMILKYYGYQEEAFRIKEKTRYHKQGVSVKGIIECFKSYQIESIAYQASLHNIKTDASLPCIAFCQKDGIGHFVVIYETKEDSCVIGDPAVGIVEVLYEEFEQSYAGVIVTIEHVGRVPSVSYSSFHHFLFQECITYRKLMLKIIRHGILLSLLSAFGSYLIQLVIDQFHEMSATYYIIIFCLTYACVQLTSCYIDYRKSHLMRDGHRILNGNYVYESIISMIKYPKVTSSLDDGVVQGYIMSFYELSSLCLSLLEKGLLEFLTLVVMIVALMCVNINLSFMILSLFIIFSFICYRMLNKIQELSKHQVQSLYIFQNQVLERIQTVLLMKRMKSFHSLSQDIFQEFNLVEEQKYRLDEMLTQMRLTLTIMMMFIYSFVFSYGLTLLQRGDMTIGEIMMSYMLVSYCLDPFIHILMLLCEYKQNIAIYEKYKIFHREGHIEKKQAVGRIKSIQLDHVSFAYGYTKPILSYIDLTIDRHTLIQGKTGSGKSTLLKLIVGLEEDYQGNIYINDIDRKKVSDECLALRIGYVFSQPQFVKGTVLDNLMCDDQEKVSMYLSLFELEEYADLLHVEIDIWGQPLSQGQRQVIALLSVLCQNYDVIILDEIFSHMDQALSQRLMSRMMSIVTDVIFIIVNHYTNIVNDDMMCVIIDDGKLTVRGENNGN